TLVDLLNAVLPIRLSVVDGPIENPNVLEKHVRSGRGFMAYLQHSRTFDTAGARAILGQPTSQTVLDGNYLHAGMVQHKRNLPIERTERESSRLAPSAQPVERVAR